MLAFGELLEKLKANNDMLTYSVLSEAYAEIFGSTVRIYVNPMGFLLLSTDKEKNALGRKYCVKTARHAGKSRICSDIASKKRGAPRPFGIIKAALRLFGQQI